MGKLLDIYIDCYYYWLLLLVEISCMFIEKLINYKHYNNYWCSNCVYDVKYVLNFKVLLLLISTWIGNKCIKKNSRPENVLIKIKLL